MNRNELKHLFEEHFKQDMLALVKDKVPNVRLALARAIRTHFKQIGGAFIYDRDMNKVLKILSEDSDRDVKFVVKDILTYQHGESRETSSVNSRISESEDTTAVTIITEEPQPIKVIEEVTKALDP